VRRIAGSPPQDDLATVNDGNGRIVATATFLLRFIEKSLATTLN
jgi:hypothetical protein